MSHPWVGQYLYTVLGLRPTSLACLLLIRKLASLPTVSILLGTSFSPEKESRQQRLNK